jgi:hypothetical protein
MLNIFVHYICSGKYSGKWKLLIVASSNVDTELLSPKPEVRSVGLFRHPHTPSWRGEWSRDSFLLFEELSYCRK